MRGMAWKTATSSREQARDRAQHALRALPNVDDDVRALRTALKTLLRRYRLRALSVEVEPADQEETKDGGRHQKSEAQGGER
jgi:hypothetical protein